MIRVLKGIIVSMVAWAVATFAVSSLFFAVGVYGRSALHKNSQISLLLGAAFGIYVGLRRPQTRRAAISGSVFGLAIWAAFLAAYLPNAMGMPTRSIWGAVIAGTIFMAISAAASGALSAKLFDWWLRQDEEAQQKQPPSFASHEGDHIYKI
jgi:hypothetical protein